MKNKLAFWLGILSEFLVTFTTSKDSKKIPPFEIWYVESARLQRKKIYENKSYDEKENV